jgi:hypothetical protein
MNLSQIIRIRMQKPFLYLFSKEHNVEHALGAGPTQFTHKGIACSNVKTVKITIGAVGVAGCDKNFTTAANTNEQVIDLGAIVPALARVLDVKTRTEVAFAGTSLSALVMETGNSSSGAQFIASATIMAANAITAANLTTMSVAPAAAASKVYCAATPTGANWSAITAGKVAVYVTYIEV